jgi:hypothetical protein
VGRGAVLLPRSCRCRVRLILRRYAPCSAAACSPSATSTASAQPVPYSNDPPSPAVAALQGGHRWRASSRAKPRAASKVQPHRRKSALPDRRSHLEQARWLTGFFLPALYPDDLLHGLQRRASLLQCKVCRRQMLPTEDTLFVAVIPAKRSGFLKLHGAADLYSRNIRARAPREPFPGAIATARPSRFVGRAAQGGGEDDAGRRVVRRGALARETRAAEPRHAVPGV